MRDKRVALVTGANQGIGTQIAKDLVAHGFTVLVGSRNLERGEAAAKEIGPNAIALQLDVTDQASITAAAERIRRETGRLDVLINNASTFYPTPVGKITRAAWDDLMGSNLRAPLFLAQAAAAHLARQRGLIINVVDIHGLRPLKGHPVYSIAKAGLAMLTRSLARELGPDIRVNGIAPGPVLWAEHGLDDGMKREIVDKTTLKRVGSPRDIARTALFLVRDAPYITGQIIAVDGGRSI